MFDNETPQWVGYTYVAYCSVVLLICIALPLYAVLFNGQSGWWVLAGFAMSAFGFRPARWRQITAVEDPDASS